ncbi:MAG TPA: hypothetical protein VFD62_17360 [Pyrinomonadaceae bacterium]|nr:hypothetical protein [Pyrinomonadaceae bacterium]
MLTTDTNDTYSQLELTSEQQDLINRVSVLARENFAPRRRPIRSHRHVSI